IRHDGHDQVRARAAAEDAIAPDDEIHPEQRPALAPPGPARLALPAGPAGPGGGPRVRPSKARSSRPYVAAIRTLSRTSRKCERPCGKYRTRTATLTIGRPAHARRTTISGSKSMRSPNRWRSRSATVGGRGKQRKPQSGACTASEPV